MADDTKFDLTMQIDDLENVWEFEAERLLSKTPAAVNASEILRAVSTVDNLEAFYVFLWKNAKGEVCAKKTTLKYPESADVRLFGVLECMDCHGVTFAHVHGSALRAGVVSSNTTSVSGTNSVPEKGIPEYGDDDDNRRYTVLQIQCVLSGICEKTDHIAEAIASLQKYVNLT